MKINKNLYVLILFFIPNFLFGGEWVAVDSGIIEINFKENELDEKLWRYIKSASIITFEPKEKYIYQYKLVNSKEIFINALCDSWNRKDLSKEFIKVVGGGACNFQIFYNFKKGEFSKLTVNERI